eukprot:3605603-Alexandrium_andersonii.AAC.1
MHACPKCETVYPAGTDERVERSLSMQRQRSILKTVLRDPDVRTLLQLNTDEKDIENQPTERGQRARGGVITSTMFCT